MGISIGGNKGESSSSSTSTSSSWLLDLLRPMIEGAVSGVGTIPENVLADMTPAQKEALDKLTQGQNWGGMIGGANQLGQWASGQIGAGSSLTQQGMADYRDIMDKLQGGGYQEMVNNMYNSDLVNQQIGLMGEGVQAQLDKNIQQLNQSASSGGNMGSSRAGVSQGVMTGEAAKALATGTAQIQGNAWNQALSSANQQASNMLQGALGGISQGNQMFNTGGNMFNSSMGWGSNIMGGMQNDLFNKFQAGSIQQGWNQAQIDNDRLNQLIKQNPQLAQLQLLLPIIGGTAGWGGTTTGSGSGSTSGSNWGMSMNFANPGKSDARLKDNVTTVQEGRVVVKDDKEYHLPRIVRWEWNDLALELFKENKLEFVPNNIGVLAQELEEIGLGDFVEYIGTEVDGLDGMVRQVNYPKLIAYAKELGVIKDDEGAE